MNIAEQPRPINDAEDYAVRFQCGCSVTFLGSSFHHTSRMECCSNHNGWGDSNERDRMSAEAKHRLAMAKLMQPPR